MNWMLTTPLLRGPIIKLTTEEMYTLEKIVYQKNS
jgi:hypothetical protein